jgi:hypothetical protein
MYLACWEKLVPGPPWEIPSFSSLLTLGSSDRTTAPEGGKKGRDRKKARDRAKPPPSKFAERLFPSIAQQRCTRSTLHKVLRFKHFWIGYHFLVLWLASASSCREIRPALAELRACGDKVPGKDKVSSNRPRSAHQHPRLQLLMLLCHPNSSCSRQLGSEQLWKCPRRRTPRPRPCRFWRNTRRIFLRQLKPTWLGCTRTITFSSRTTVKEKGKPKNTLPQRTGRSASGQGNTTFRALL